MFGSATPFGSSTFGSSSSAFGSSSGTTFGSSGFGTGTSLFGAKTTGTTGFGTGAPSQSGTSLFGNTGTGSTGLFGSANPSGFGSANTQNTSGFGGFGSTGTTGSLFGNSGTSGTSLFSGSTNAFGSANKSIFGTSTNTSGSIFGAPSANTGTSLFGAKPQATGGLFGSSTTGGLFGSTAAGGQNAAGTPHKFTAQTSTDTMMKNGIQSSINTKHQCITLMKEYNGKSLEELRMEDYQLGRKGPQAGGTGTAGGTGLFGSAFGASTGGMQSSVGSGFGTTGSSGTGLFGQSGTSSIFGAKTTSGGLFGASSTTFSAPSAFSSTSGGLFGTKPGGLFGTTTTQSTGLFGTPTPSFGTASSGSSLFGTSAFGQNTQQTGLFGASAQSGSSIFGKPTGFGTGTSGTGSGLFGTTGFGQPGQSLFGAKTSTSGLGSFGSTNTGSLFGTQNKPTFGPTFGTTTSSSGLFGNSSGTGLFGNTSGLNFGAGTSTFSQPFGSSLGSGFGQSTLCSTGTSMVGPGQNNVAALQYQQQQQLQQQVFALTSSPFGDSPLFRNLTSRTKTEKPLTLTSRAKHRGTNTPSQYKLSPRPSARVKPRPNGKLNFSQSRLFDGLDDDIEFNSETFVPRRSIKKLVLNRKSQNGSLTSELSDSTREKDKNRSRDRSPDVSHSIAGGASNGEISGEKLNPPKQSPSSSNDEQDSPVVGIRRSNVPRRSHDLSRQGVGIGDRKVVTEQVSTDDEGSGVRSRDHVVPQQESESEQGPEPKEGDMPKVEAQRNDDRRGCGVILERSEYFCIPSIPELDDMVDENGDVIVSDFVVGREGFGMVKFFGECNVAGLNLDEIVSFRRREVEVYPDTYANKPAVGNGLNRKSEITLYKVWPNDKTTRTPIKNPDRLKKVGWLEKLENATARLGATFVDYLAETGTWIFTVEHFTRYGLKEVQIEIDDGSAPRPPLRSFIEDKEKLLAKSRLEKEKAEIAMKLRLEEEMENRKKLMEEKLYDDSSSFLEAQDDSHMTDISQETFPEFLEPLEDDTTSPASHHLATAMGVESRRMQVMKASFFGQSDTDEAQDRYINNNDMRPREYRLRNKSVLSSTGYDEYDGKRDRLIYSPVKTKSMTIYPEPLAQEDFRSAKERKTDYKNYRSQSAWYSLPQPMLLPSVVGSPSEAALKAAGIRTQPALVPLSRSVVAGRHNLIADAGLTMGRSFRVGWGPGWTLVYSSRTAGGTGVLTSQRLEHEKVKGSPFPSSMNDVRTSSFAVIFSRVNVNPAVKWDSDVCQAQLIERLQISLANANRDESDGSPYFNPVEGRAALHQHAEMATRNKELLVPGPLKTSSEIFSSVMDLAVALWGNFELMKESMETDNEDRPKNNYDEAHARKEALSNWLAVTSRPVIDKEIEHIKAKDNGHLPIIFSMLTGRQMSSACQVAQANGDWRLSLLLAQSCGNMTVRQWLLKQLDDWSKDKVDKFITVDRLRIYALLAGELAWQGIKVCRDLDWKRAFALHLWYQRSSSSLIPDALASYENSFKGRTSTGVYAADPSPHYLRYTENSSQNSESEEEGGEKRCRDTCYHLIKLFCKPTHRLETTLAPASYTRHQLDVSLSWHLYQILRSVRYNHLSEFYDGYLNTGYAAQLEAMGLWHWAIFALLHIKNPVRREQSVREVLVRYCVLSDDADYSSKETFLIDELGIPVAWIHEAKVIRARIENRPHDEAYHLLKSGNFNLCHDVILNCLASSAIINEEYDSIKELLVEIAPRENCSQVNHWNTGGLIYLDYIKLWEKFNDIKEGLLVPNTYQLEKMQTKVSSLCHRISQLPSKTATDRLCQSDMGTMCANFLKIIAKELAVQAAEANASYYTQSSVLAPHIQKLPLPEDCCLTELRELTSSYVNELAQL